MAMASLHPPAPRASRQQLIISVLLSKHDAARLDRANVDLFPEGHRAAVVLNSSAIEAEEQATSSGHATRTAAADLGLAAGPPEPPEMEKAGVDNHKPVVVEEARSRSVESKIDLKASPAAKFLLKLMPWELTPSPLTPGIMATVPFLWEDVPGKRKLHSPLLPSPFPALQLPPRLLPAPANQLPQKFFHQVPSVSTFAEPETSNPSSSSSSSSSTTGIPFSCVEEKLQKSPQHASPYLPAYSSFNPSHHQDSNSSECSGKAAGGSASIANKLPFQRKWMHWITKSEKEKRRKSRGVHHGVGASLLGDAEGQDGDHGAFGKKPEISLNSKIAAAMDARGLNTGGNRELSKSKEDRNATVSTAEHAPPTGTEEPAQPRGLQRRRKWGFMKFRRTCRFFAAIYGVMRRSVILRKSWRRRLLGDSKVQYKSLL